MRRLTALVMTATAIATTPFAAVAASVRHDIAPKPNALLGGGIVGVTHAAGHWQLQNGLVTVTVGKSGKNINFYGDFVARCQGYKGGPFRISMSNKNVPLKADGSFAMLDAMVGDTKGTYTFDGSFLDPVTATGTTRSRFTLRPAEGGGPYSCDTGEVK